MNAQLRLLGTLIMIGAVALATSACGKKKAGPQGRPPVAVKLATAIQTNAPVAIAAYGSVQDRASVEIIPQVSGVLLGIFIQEGAVVTNGQPLFQIDPSDYQMRVQQAEGMVAADRSNLELARSTLKRNQPLLDKHLISADYFDIIKTRVAALESQLKMDEASLDQARLNLSRCTIVAPLAGICSKRYLDAGNLAAAGMTRLTNIRSYDPLRLECSVSEQYLPSIRSALAAGPITVTVSPRGDTETYPGTLTFMDNAVNAAAGTILLRGEVPNAGMKLWANQFVDVRIILSSIPDAVMVPESAVLFGKNGSYLYVADQEQKAGVRPVKTGVRDNDWVQITGGLAAGERVVVLGQLTLYPGATVMDVSQMPAANAGKK